MARIDNQANEYQEARKSLEALLDAYFASTSDAGRAPAVIVDQALRDQEAQRTAGLGEAEVRAARRIFDLNGDGYDAAIAAVLDRQEQARRPVVERALGGQGYGSLQRVRLWGALIAPVRQARRALWGNPEPPYPVAWGEWRELLAALQDLRRWLEDSTRCKVPPNRTILRLVALPDANPTPEPDEGWPELHTGPTLPNTTRKLDLTKQLDAIYARASSGGLAQGWLEAWLPQVHLTAYLATGCRLNPNLADGRASATQLAVAQGEPSLPVESLADLPRSMYASFPYICLRIYDPDNVSPAAVKALYEQVRAGLSSPVTGKSLDPKTEALAMAELELIVDHARRLLAQGEVFSPPTWQWRPSPDDLRSAFQRLANQFLVDAEAYSQQRGWQAVKNRQRSIPIETYHPALYGLLEEASAIPDQ